MIISTCEHNEANYLRPWVEYHKRLGFNQIWMYESQSSPYLLRTLYRTFKEDIRRGDIVLFKWDFNVEHQQLS